MTELRHHALHAFLQQATAGTADAGSITLAVNPGLQHINMRADASDAALLGTVAAVLGQDIPARPNTTSRAEHKIFWLGPDEWLIVTAHNAQELLVALRAAVDDQFATFVDISDGLLSLTLSGEHSREVLAKGCTLDLHRESFVPGDCAQTTLAKASMLITLPDAGSSFEITVRRSFAEYTALWLRQAAAEFGFRSVTI